MSSFGIPLTPLAAPDSQGKIDTTQHLADYAQLTQQISTLLQMQRAQAVKAAPQSIPNAVSTILTFDTNIYDNALIHSISVNPTRFTAQSSGFYKAFAQFNVPPSGGTIRALWVDINGVLPNPLAITEVTPGVNCAIQVEALLQLSYLDYVEFFCYQDSGAPANTDNTRTFGSLTLLSRL